MRYCRRRGKYEYDEACVAAVALLAPAPILRGPRTGPRPDPRSRSMKKTLRPAVLGAVLALAACGDADTDDPRGYTKAPIENPGWTIESEEPTEMAELGDPIRIPALDTLAEETATPAQPLAPAQSTNPQPGETQTQDSRPAPGTPQAP